MSNTAGSVYCRIWDTDYKLTCYYNNICRQTRPQLFTSNKVAFDLSRILLGGVVSTCIEQMKVCANFTTRIRKMISNTKTNVIQIKSDDRKYSHK